MFKSNYIGISTDFNYFSNFVSK